MMQFNTYVLNLGMGIESAAILTRWLLEPESRPFENLANLIVLSAQTGDELPLTQQLCETYLLPLMRQYQIRYVQVARSGASQKAGYTVLSDTRSPDHVYIDGDFKLSTELITDGIVPRLNRPHLCAIKTKAYPLDGWIEANLNEPIYQVFGYNRDEKDRATKAQDYTLRHERLLCPLFDWDWSRADCQDYLFEQFGVVWQKSACSFCPFSTRELAKVRFRDDPIAAGFTIFVERLALSMNPRMQLYGFGTAYDLAVELGLEEALTEYQRLMTAQEWGIYRVRRIYKAYPTRKGGKMINADRDVVRLVTLPTEAAALAKLPELSGDRPIVLDKAPPRFYEQERQPNTYPSIEAFVVITPALIRDKCRNLKSFQAQWLSLTGELSQLKLF